MTISLGGAPGPRAGGMTPMGGRTVQAPPPPEPVRRAETPPAAKPPEMTLPSPNVRPRPRPERAPPDATGRTPTTGPEPQEGRHARETGARGQGFGLTTGGGGGTRRAARRRQLLLPGVHRADGDADPAQLAAEPGRARARR